VAMPITSVARSPRPLFAAAQPLMPARTARTARTACRQDEGSRHSACRGPGRQLLSTPVQLPAPPAVRQGGPACACGCGEPTLDWRLSCRHGEGDSEIDAAIDKNWRPTALAMQDSRQQSEAPSVAAKAGTFSRITKLAHAWLGWGPHRRARRSSCLLRGLPSR
jgi:hypothetical protein